MSAQGQRDPEQERDAYRAEVCSARYQQEGKRRKRKKKKNF